MSVMTSTRAAWSDTAPTPTGPGHVTADAELEWLEELIDARLHTARRNDRLRRVAVRGATVLSATGVGFWMGWLLR